MKYCCKEDDVFYHTVMTNTKTKTDKFPGRMDQCLQVVSFPWSCIKAEMSLAHDTVYLNTKTKTKTNTRTKTKSKFRKY